MDHDRMMQHIRNNHRALVEDDQARRSRRMFWRGYRWAALLALAAGAIFAAIRHG